jgi:membrane protein implicated in regulation of membrane protease activity
MFGEGASFPVMEVGGLLAAGYSIYQAKQLHNIELSKAKEHHQETIKLAEDQHKKNLAEVKRTYLLELFNNLEQHFQQLNADLIASSKESERDMFDQRNQSFQTIILASSVMFTALSTAMTNGLIPLQSSEVFVIGYALTTSLSFGFLFLCVVVCIELVLRASSFMYRRAHKHTEALRDAIEKTKDMMRRLRARSRLPSSNIPGTIKETPKTGRSIVTMDDNALNDEWFKHEIEIQNYLSEREKINDATAVVANTGGEESNKKSFQQFWNESCKFWAELAILFFYAGTLNMLLSILIFMWTQFFLAYESVVSAIIAVTLILFSLVLGVAAVILARILKLRDKEVDCPAGFSRRSSSSSSFGTMADVLPPLADDSEQGSVQVEQATTMRANVFGHSNSNRPGKQNLHHQFEKDTLALDIVA